MITRAQMPRQLRDKGGIASVTPRENYGLGSKIKERFRKLIPNELADVAVKAAPFVAPFNPGVAGLMRGIGRFDQRGSISDALKQGAATFGFGKLAGKIPGTQDYFGKGMEGAKALAGDIRTKAGSLFEGGGDTPKFTGKDKPGFLGDAAEKLFKNVPLSDKIPTKVKEKLLVGGIITGGKTIYDYYTGAFGPQEPGESLEEYMARRRESVKLQTRQFMDSYYTPLRNPQYAAMSDEEKDKFIDSIVGQGMAMGGRAGYQTGGITMANTLAENIRRNLTNQAAVAQQFQAARSRLPGYVAPQKTPVQEYATSDDSILGPLSKKAASTIMEGQDKSQAALDVLNQTMAPTRTTDTGQAIRIGSGVPEEYDSLNKAFTAVQAPTQYSNISELTRVMDDVNQRANDTVIRSLAEAQEYVNQTGMPRAITQDDIDTFNFIPPKADTDPMLVGFDYSKEINWSPGQPAPEGYRVVNMMGDEFLERKFPSKEEVARLPMPLMGPGMMPPLNAPEDPDAGLSGQEYAEKYGIPYALGGRVGFSKGANLKIKLKQIGYEDTLLDKLNLKELRELLDSEKGTFTDQGTYREPAKKGGMPTGIMKTNKAGVMERDYRDKGGFVPVGIKEKADDVPAMLSKNEFVFTADAVRGAGNGSIEKGAQRMYDTMKNLERRVT